MGGEIFPRVFRADLREKSLRATDRIRRSRKIFFGKIFSIALAVRAEAIALKPCTHQASRRMRLEIDS